MCQLGGSGYKMGFMPTRRGNVPCCSKFDTEAAAQLFVPYKERVKARELAMDRKDFNDWVWSKVVNVDRLVRRFKGFRFHHELTTDGVSASVLLSRPEEKKEHSKHLECKGGEQPLSMAVGLDPGRKNLIMSTDVNGVSLRYTSQQRIFESKMKRYREVLNLEKGRHGISEVEAELSKHNHRTVDPSKYREYLVAKSKADKLTESFYRQEKWRNWKFRIHCHRRSSEDKFCNRMAETYGRDCTVYFGDWSASTQQKGCAPSPTVGIRRLLSKRFKVINVDEFRTSRICNACQGDLKKYRNKKGRLSYSRLHCPWCSSEKYGPKFVDRDANAAANILLVGTSLHRPKALSRTWNTLTERRGSLSLEAPRAGGRKSCSKAESRSNKPPVGAGGPSSNPASPNSGEIREELDNAYMRL